MRSDARASSGRTRCRPRLAQLRFEGDDTQVDLVGRLCRRRGHRGRGKHAPPVATDEGVVGRGRGRSRHVQPRARALRAMDATADVSAGATAGWLRGGGARPA